MKAINLPRFSISIVFLLFSTVMYAQVRGSTLTPKNKTVPKPAFVCSNYVWSWYQNGLTTFTFSMKNQSGHDVKRVRYRVLFFDRQGSQIDFAESQTEGIPNGLAQRESVTLDFDTGMSTRKLSSSQKVEILDFKEAP